MKRVATLLLLLAAVLVLALPASAQTPTPKPACHSFLPVIGCNGIVSGVLNTVGGIASGQPAPAVAGTIQVGQSAAAAGLRGTAGFFVGNMGGAISSASRAIVRELDGATIPANFPSWFLDSWGVTRNLGFQILFLCYVIAIIAAVLKANLARVVQTPLLAAAAIGGMFLTLVLVSVVVQVVDWTCLQITHGTSANIDTVMRSFGSVLNVSSITAPGSNVFIGVGVLLLTLVALAIVFFNLLVRRWIIYIATGMFGLALSGSLTKAGAKWLKFLAVLLGTVIASKLLLVVILSYGVSALASPSSVSDVAGGGSVFLISGLAPWVLVGIVLGGSIHALHGGAQAAGQPVRMGKDAMNSARRTHNHWQSFRSRSQAQAAQRTVASQKALAAHGKAAASSVFQARVAAAAKAAAMGTGVGAVATAATAAAGAAKKATKAVKRAPAKVANTVASPSPQASPVPSGWSQTQSGLIRPTPRAPSRPTSGGWTCSKCGHVMMSSTMVGCVKCGHPR